MHKLISLTFILSVASLPAWAQDLPFDECFSGASTRYSINKALLVAIAKTESSLNPLVISPTNKNGTYDIGLMQINSSWMPTLRKYGITNNDLLSGCTSIYVGAWIMANNISRHGATWRAVGAYNAATNSKRELYVSKVQKNLNALSLASN